MCTWAAWRPCHRGGCWLRFRHQRTRRYLRPLTTTAHLLVDTEPRRNRTPSDASPRGRRSAQGAGDQRIYLSLSRDGDIGQRWSPPVKLPVKSKGVQVRPGRQEHACSYTSCTIRACTVTRVSVCHHPNPLPLTFDFLQAGQVIGSVRIGASEPASECATKYPTP